MSSSISASRPPVEVLCCLTWNHESSKLTLLYQNFFLLAGRFLPYWLSLDHWFAESGVTWIQIQYVSDLDSLGLSSICVCFFKYKVGKNPGWMEFHPICKILNILLAFNRWPKAQFASCSYHMNGTRIQVILFLPYERDKNPGQIWHNT